MGGGLDQHVAPCHGADMPLAAVGNGEYRPGYWSAAPNAADATKAIAIGAAARFLAAGMPSWLSFMVTRMAAAWDSRHGPFRKIIVIPNGASCLPSRQISEPDPPAGAGLEL